jgi:hypothetical protein
MQSVLPSGRLTIFVIIALNRLTILHGKAVVERFVFEYVDIIFDVYLENNWNHKQERNNEQGSGGRLLVEA